MITLQARRKEWKLAWMIGFGLAFNIRLWFPDYEIFLNPFFDFDFVTIKRVKEQVEKEAKA